MRRFIKTTFLTAALSLGAQISYAGPLDDGQAAYEAGHMQSAFGHFLSAATAGDAEGQFYVGQMYFEGIGITKSNDMAGVWFAKSAEQGYADSMSKMGGMHEEGMGQSFSPELAKYWYGRAAAKGDSYAKTGLTRLNTIDPDKQLELASLYFDGKNAPLNKQLAAYWYEKSAHQGVTAAMVYLGAMLEDGDGIPMDQPAALEWYKKAAAAGNFIAQDAAVKLSASMTLQAGNTKPDGFFGDGVVPQAGTFPKGFSLYNTPAADPVAALTAKAEAGDAEAQEKLGLMYYNGDGVKQSYEKAEPWLDKASIERRVDAMMAYAKMFEDGLGVEQEDWAAKFWYGEAAKKGNVEADAWVAAYNMRQGITAPKIYRAAPENPPVPEVTIGSLYKVRTLTDHEETFKVLRSDNAVEIFNKGHHAEARKIWMPYAEAGLCRQQRFVGDTYERESNYAEAMIWYQRALAGTGEYCDSEYARAAYVIGVFYFEGRGVEKNANTAAGWFKYSADIKYGFEKTSAYILGMLYQSGRGIPKDEYESYVYFSKAAGDGHIKAKVELAYIFEVGHPKGWGMKSEKIIQYYTDAANEGYDYGQFRLAHAYFYGKNTPQSFEKAFHWFEKAAEQGHKESQFNLGLMYANGEGVPRDIKKSIYWNNKSAAQGYAAAIKRQSSVGR